MAYQSNSDTKLIKTAAYADHLRSSGFTSVKLADLQAYYKAA